MFFEARPQVSIFIIFDIFQQLMIDINDKEEVVFAKLCTFIASFFKVAFALSYQAF